YTGRIARAAFTTWAESVRGRSALERVAARTRFSLFGRMWAARRRVWRQLTESAADDAVVVAVQHEVDAYLARLGTLGSAHELPRVVIDLRRLVVVPRLMANDEAYRKIESALHAQPAFGALDGGESLRDWLSLQIVEGIETAVAGAQPSPRRPLPAGNGWLTV